MSDAAAEEVSVHSELTAGFADPALIAPIATAPISSAANTVRRRRMGILVLCVDLARAGIVAAGCGSLYAGEAGGLAGKGGECLGPGGRRSADGAALGALRFGDRRARRGNCRPLRPAA